MKYVVRSHLKIFIVFFLAFVILRFEVPNSIADVMDIFSLWIGGAIGMMLLDLDRLIHVYIEHPDSDLSREFKFLVKEQRWKQALDYLNDHRYEQEHLAFRNGIFAVVLLPVLLFVNTSSAGLFGKGLASGVMLHFLFDAWRDYLRDRPRFNEWILWMVQKDIPVVQKKYFLWGMTVIFGLLTLLVL